MENIHVILILVIILFVIFISNKRENKDNKENLDTTTATLNLSNEAIQNIASVYNTQNMQVTNLKATGDINFAQFKGIIVAWSGAIADIPKGWGLCDGTKYKALDNTDLQSPDLRSSFIIGASKPNTRTDGQVSGPDGQPNMYNKYGYLTPYQVNDRDGEEKHRLTVAEMPLHNHSIFAANGGHTAEGCCWGGGSGITTGCCGHGITGALNGGSGTERYIDNTGGGQTHNNMPPFYALAYIIKL